MIFVQSRRLPSREERHMSEDDFITLLKEKIYATADAKGKRAKKAEFDRDAILAFAAAVIKMGPTGGLPALKTLWEQQFGGAPTGEDHETATEEDPCAED